MLQADESLAGEKNHPLALWMAVIAFINFNMPIACIYGSFSVLLAAVEARLGVSQELAVLGGASAVSFACAIFAPIAGALAARYSLRWIMVLGSLLLIAGFVMLAFTTHYIFYVLAFGLLIGPGMAVGVVLPGTLVTRWFLVNRGKALGFMTTALVIVITPQISTWMLHAHGLSATFLMLGAMAGASTISSFFIVDRPPGAATVEGAAPAPVAAGGMTMAQLMSSTRFWGLTCAFVASAVSSIVLTVHMVPLAHSWGQTATQGATLLSTMSLVGIVGTNLFGWISDRLGAAVAVSLVVLDSGLLWLLLLLHPSFPMAVVLIGLIGLNASGITPAFSAALSEVFGRESFSRAYGLCQLIILPFSVLCAPAAALVYTRTNSYAGALIAVAAFLLVASLTAISARRRRPVVAPA